MAVDATFARSGLSTPPPGYLGVESGGESGDEFDGRVSRPGLRTVEGAPCKPGQRGCVARAALRALRARSLGMARC